MAEDDIGGVSDVGETLRNEERRDAAERAGRVSRGRDFSGGERDEKRIRMRREQERRSEPTTSANAAPDETVSKLGGTPFLDQDRSAKVKSIYAALVRDHPEYPAAMKARIAARKGKRSKQARKSPAHGGPPYRGPLTPSDAGGGHLAKAAASFFAETARLAKEAGAKDYARAALVGGLSGAVMGALREAADAPEHKGAAAWRGAKKGARWGAISGVTGQGVKSLTDRAWPKLAELRERFKQDRLRRLVRSWDDGGACLDGERLHGGKADGKPASAFDPQAVRTGMRVEREHTRDPRLQREIARDHLSEDPRYYAKLRKMEKTAGGYEFKAVNAGVKPLTPEERAEVMAAGAVWHHGPHGEATPAVRKSVVNGKTVYWCATHRAWRYADTLKGAIRHYRFIKTTA